MGRRRVFSGSGRCPSGVARSHRPVSSSRPRAAAIVRSALLSLVVAFLLPAVGLCETIVDHNITVDTTWTVGGSPYIVYGVDPPANRRIVVRFNSALTIDPGVEVRFRAGTRLETDAGSSIVAVGAEGDSIYFTSDEPEPSAESWYGVQVFNSPGSELRFCAFEHAQYGLYLSVSSPDVHKCTFRNCDVGMFLMSAPAQVTAPEVTSCWLIDNVTRGAWLVGNGTTPHFEQCNLMRNGGNMRLDNYTEPVEVYAQFCWWGTNQLTYIEGTIVHGLDPDHGEGIVIYEPWLNQVPVEPSSWGSIKALFR